jgi:hypothetical protein
MRVMTTALGPLAALLLMANVSPSFADTTGNPSNNPAIIQGLEPLHGPRQYSPVSTFRGPAVLPKVKKHCTHPGEDEGIRNPDYVECFE